jgi:putative transposase
MQLVEQHLIRKSDPRYASIDQVAFASKNLYNQATYQIRQAFIHEGKYLSYAEIFHRVKHLDCYQALPRKVSNSILILIDKNWKSFRKSLREWKKHPEKYTGKPKIPGYKHKEKGRNLLIYDKQALGKRAFKKTGKLVPSGLTRGSSGRPSIRCGLSRVDYAMSWRWCTRKPKPRQRLTSAWLPPSTWA